MSLFESITHKDEIKQIQRDAKKKYNAAFKEMESQRKDTNKHLQNLGKAKIYAMSTSMNEFVDTFSIFKNIIVDEKRVANIRLFGNQDNPRQMILNMKTASRTADQVVQEGVAVVGTGALIGIACYGGAMMLAKDSSGNAIKSLSGAAKKNATLEWFGGGSKKDGGLGADGGAIVLAGIVLVPILVVGSILAGISGNEKLAEAKKKYAEAENAAAKFDVITTGMAGVSVMSDNYSNFITKFDKKFTPFVNELRKIKETHSKSPDGRIDYNSLSNAEKNTIHLSWLLAQLYYGILCAPILTDKGELTSESETILLESRENLKEIKKSAFRMTGDDVRAANLIWAPIAKRMLVVNFIAMAILIALGCKFLSENMIRGCIYFLDSLVAFPLFFMLKNIPASKLFVLRIVRLVFAFALIVLAEVFLRGGF